jgi:Na+/melibiose symporter-like transporter
MSLAVDAVRPRAAGRALALYFGALTLVLGFSDPSGIIWLPVQFLLKDRLGFGPQHLAMFEAIVLIPASVGFLCGWIRDRWRPKRLGDRAYFLTAGLLATGCYLLLASPGATSDYLRLAGGILLAAVAFEMISAAAEAMMTATAQSYTMTGRLSAADELAQLVAEIAALVVGGWLASRATANVAFLVAAVSTSAIIPLALWCPRPVRAVRPESPPLRAPEESRGYGSARRNGTLWLVVAVLALWNFSPGWSTPLLYFLTSQIGLSPQEFGLYRAANYVGIAAATAMYGWLCLRQPVGRILRWTIPINVCAGVLLLFIAGPSHAIAVGALVGLLTGFANVALFDLARRACPPESLGMGTMLAFSAWTCAGVAGDLFGAWIYERAGLSTCIATDVVTNALILPLLARLPKGLRETRDGESIPIMTDRLAVGTAP